MPSKSPAQARREAAAAAPGTALPEVSTDKRGSLLKRFSDKSRKGKRPRIVPR